MSDKTKKILFEAIDGVKVGCQDWLTVCALAVTVPNAMGISIEYNNNFDKAWKMYKKAMLAIKTCKKFPSTKRKATIKRLSEDTLRSIQFRPRNNNKVILSKETILEVIDFIKKLPKDAFAFSPNSREQAIIKFQKILNEK